MKFGGDMLRAFGVIQPCRAAKGEGGQEGDWYFMFCINLFGKEPCGPRGGRT